jgi:general secretion pathway protein K
LDSVRSTLSNKQGFALVAAIWLVGLTMVVATEFASHLRLTTLLAANRVQQTKLTSIAEGMVRLSVWQLSKDSTGLGTSLPSLCSWNADVIVETRVQDHAGLIDLNVAPQLLLALGFEAAGADASLALKLAKSVEDDRDADTVNENGATEAAHRDGSALKNRGFETLEELDLLADITDEIYRKAKNQFTIYAGQPGVDFNFMPTDFKSDFSDGQKTLYSAVSPRKAFRVTAIAQSTDKLRYGVSADVVITQQPDQPFTLLTWQYVSGGQDDLAHASNSLACFN